LYIAVERYNTKNLHTILHGCCLLCFGVVLLYVRFHWKTPFYAKNNGKRVKSSDLQWQKKIRKHVNLRRAEKNGARTTYFRDIRTSDTILFRRIYYGKCCTYSLPDSRIVYFFLITGRSTTFIYHHDRCVYNIALATRTSEFVAFHGRHRNRRVAIADSATFVTRP